MRFGYVVITVEGSKLAGEWRALTNFDTATMTFSPSQAAPKFEPLDRFTWQQ
jgi:hypothetical protein